MSSTSPGAHSLLAGGFGGACLCIVGAPFDVVKVRQQVSPHSSPLTVAASIARSEGVKGFWRGVTPPLMVSVPQFAIVFASFSYNRQVIRKLSGRPEGDLRDTAVAGSLVALPTTLLYTPSERVKIAMQTDGRRVALGLKPRHADALGCTAKLLREGTLFRGFLATLARDVPAWACYFVVYTAAKKRLAASSPALDGRAQLTPIASLTAGALAGAATWAVAIPMDVVKTTYQKATYHVTYRHAVRAIARRGGIGGFFAGFSTIVLGGVPRDASCLCGVEAAQRCLTLMFENT